MIHVEVMKYPLLISHYEYIVRFYEGVRVGGFVYRLHSPGTWQFPISRLATVAAWWLIMLALAVC
jgi:hypothetical protein